MLTGVKENGNQRSRRWGFIADAPAASSQHPSDQGVLWILSQGFIRILSQGFLWILSQGFQQGNASELAGRETSPLNSQSKQKSDLLGMNPTRIRAADSAGKCLERCRAMKELGDCGLK